MKTYSAVFLECTDGDIMVVTGTMDQIREILEKRKVSEEECLFFEGTPVVPK